MAAVIRETCFGDNFLKGARAEDKSRGRPRVLTGSSSAQRRNRTMAEMQHSFSQIQLLIFLVGKFSEEDFEIKEIIHNVRSSERPSVRSPS